MAADFGILSQRHFWASAEMGKMANYQRDPLCEPHRLPMENVADQFSALAHRVLLLLALEGRWTVGTDQ